MTDAPAPTPPDGWYPDPFGRYDTRRWDGTSWTDQVMVGDGMLADPEGAAAGARVVADVAPDLVTHDDDGGQGQASVTGADPRRGHKRLWLAVGAVVAVLAAAGVGYALTSGGGNGNHKTAGSGSARFANFQACWDDNGATPEECYREFPGHVSPTATTLSTTTTTAQSMLEVWWSEHGQSAWRSMTATYQELIAVQGSPQESRAVCGRHVADSVTNNQILRTAPDVQLSADLGNAAVSLQSAMAACAQGDFVNTKGYMDAAQTFTISAIQTMTSLGLAA